MKTFAKRTITVLLALVLVFALCACQLVSVDEEADKAQVVATVNGVEILKSDYQAMADQLAYYYSSWFGADTSDPEILAIVQESAIESLVQTEVIVQKAKELNIALPTEEEFQAHIDEMNETYYRPNAITELGEGATEEAIVAKIAELFQEELDYSGMTLEDYKASFSENELYNKVVEHMHGLSTITDEEILAWYDTKVAEQQTAIAENPASFETANSAGNAFVVPEGYGYYKHILVGYDETDTAAIEAETAKQEEYAAEMTNLIVADKTANAARIEELEVLINQSKTVVNQLSTKLIGKAEEVYALTATEDFDALITEYGSDPGAASNPKGYLVSAASTGFVQAFTDACAALANVGDISAPVLTEHGYHIIKKVEALEARTVPFEEVKEYCSTQALTEKQSADWNATIEEWVAAAEVVYKDANLEDLSSKY